MKRVMELVFMEVVMSGKNKNLGLLHFSTFNLRIVVNLKVKNFLLIFIKMTPTR